jgi:3'5'-cyclic nucleotide phosphodiesterase
VFSALVHDLDHPGVVNGQLCKEGHEWASRYNNQSVAEQHSLDLAFRLLEKDQFKNLRRAIYPTVEEKKRFRRLVVNMVMATGTNYFFFCVHLTIDFHKI